MSQGCAQLPITMEVFRRTFADGWGEGGCMQTGVRSQYRDFRFWFSLYSGNNSEFRSFDNRLSSWQSSQECWVRYTFSIQFHVFWTRDPAIQAVAVCQTGHDRPVARQKNAAFNWCKSRHSPYQLRAISCSLLRKVCALRFFWRLSKIAFLP